MKSIRKTQYTVAAVALILCFWGWFRSAQVLSPVVASSDFLQLPALARLEPQLVRTIFLGTPRVYQAYLSKWNETLFADQNLKSEQSNQLFSAFDIVARHEPISEWFYLGPCLVFSERLQRPDLCFSITGYGQKTLPTSWRIPLVQAYVELSRQKNSDRARFYLEIAGKKPGAPSQIINDFLQTGATPNISMTSLAELLGKTGFERYGIQIKTDG